MSAALESIVRDHYGLEPLSLAPLPGEYDRNVRIDTADGRTVLLKIMHAGCDAEALAMQVAVLEHLAARAPALPVQHVIRAPSGKPVLTVEIDGEARLVWLLSYLPGDLYAHTPPHTAALLDDLGRVLAVADKALADFTHPAAERELKWDLRHPLWIADALTAIADPGRRAIVEAVIGRFEREVQPRLDTLPAQVIHNDANDYNLLVATAEDGTPRISGLIDFGDALHSSRIAELAIAGAYAAFGQADPLGALCTLAAGYDRENPLRDDEIAALFPMMLMRLAVSVTNAAVQKQLKPDDAYVTVSEDQGWQVLTALHRVEPQVALARLASACGRPLLEDQAATLEWIRSQRGRFAPLLGSQAAMDAAVMVDLSVGSHLTAGDDLALDAQRLGARIDALLAEHGQRVGIGYYNEARMIYTEHFFRRGPRETDDRRTVHLGVDVFAPAGTPVHAPLAGEVMLVDRRDVRQDYGPVVVLRHQPPGLTPFWTLYGHLSAESVAGLKAGDTVAAGQMFARMGTPAENVDWPPHVHLQLVIAPLADPSAAPGVAFPAEALAFSRLCPNPAALINLADERLAAPQPSDEALLAERGERLGPSVRLSYRKPVHVRRGWRQYLYDAQGQAYLDAYNNVPHVGHSHPAVVEAVTRQMAVLNTNTRYLHETVLRYAEALTARLPAPLSVCFFLNSASEANELALRLARAATGNHDMVVMDQAYHGHTSALIDISPYKHNGPGGQGTPGWVHVTPIPDTYRGAHRGPDAGARYAEDTVAIIQALERPVAGYIAESLPSVGGQIVPPAGFLAPVYEAVREAGGVCIADEVQTGLGRLGHQFWGFERQDVVPDIVVLGKPIGNGHPLAALVTTPAIARAFDTGMEFFSTFGGNPVSCAAGLAVLEVLDREGLQANAAAVGDALLAGLAELKARHAVIGDVRGVGLFLGVELVQDHDSLAPATRAAGHLKNRLRDERILVGTDGPHDNVLKIRPPLPFTLENAEHLLATMDRILAEPALRRMNS